MKIKLLYMALAALLVTTSCRKDDDEEIVPIETQNSYDDAAALKFLQDNYMDDLGNVVKYDPNDPADDNKPSLATLPKETLPSGTIVIMRNGAQPVPGKAIGSSDIIRLMHRTLTYVAQKGTDGNVSYTNGLSLINTLAGTGTPEIDPIYYYAPTSKRNGKDRTFYEIEGFREALQKFKSSEIDDSSNYNLQGLIIVPSRAAYARDSNVFDSGTSLFWDRSFVFNFQVYKTTARPANEM